MSVRPNAHLSDLSRTVHGSVTSEELRGLGLDPQQVLDFSVNTNPFGPAPGVLEALRQVDVQRYPDPEAWELREALGKELRLPVECILAGNGSVELVWLLARSYLGLGDLALVLGPTFGEYEAASKAAGAEVLVVAASPGSSFLLDLERVSSLLASQRPRAVFLCNPNNPTGTFIPPSRVRELVEAYPDLLFVVDEAYLPFLKQGSPFLSEGEGPVEGNTAPRSSSLSRGTRAYSGIGSGTMENLVVLRSMTKDCAIPGLRLGYALGPKDILEVLRVVQPPWSVSAPAQAAGLAALRDQEHLRRSLSALEEAKHYLMAALAELGLAVCPSVTNFFLVHLKSGVPHYLRSGREFRAALLREGCCVRDCTSFGLPDYIRIGVRTLPECERLVATVARVLEGSPGRDRA